MKWRGACPRGQIPTSTTPGETRQGGVKRPGIEAPRSHQPPLNGNFRTEEREKPTHLKEKANKNCLVCTTQPKDGSSLAGLFRETGGWWGPHPHAPAPTPRAPASPAAPPGQLQQEHYEPRYLSHASSDEICSNRIDARSAEERALAPPPPPTLGCGNSTAKYSAGNTSSLATTRPSLQPPL